FHRKYLFSRFQRLEQRIVPILVDCYHQIWWRQCSTSRWWMWCCVEEVKKWVQGYYHITSSWWDLHR
ncbi:MAG: hypothetical protein LUO82_03380, partial [Methanomicrobiales archaeon]|nr:hypothetical protein [Methanomicrobiales archaeon]